MTEKPDNQTELNDEQFEAYLDGNSPVSHAYREADKPEPPPALDRAILNAAEAAAKSKRKNFLDWDMEFWRSWARPVAMSSKILASSAPSSKSLLASLREDSALPNHVGANTFTCCVRARAISLSSLLINSWGGSDFGWLQLPIGDRRRRITQITR